MSQPPVGRSLLLGLLALQHSFLTNEQFFSAVDQWLKDKSSNLEALLIRVGHLPGDVVEVLRNLAQIHLRQHDDDASLSCSAITGIDSVLDSLVERNDPDLNAMFSLHPERTINSESEQSTSSARPYLGSRYETLKLHAQGGLGEVFIARDTELNRVVALKEIQDRYADNQESRNRFVVEAEVTGGLEHPGIVPVYGLGQYESGRPYYAMRFIQGASLKQVADAFHRDEHVLQFEAAADTALLQSTLGATARQTRESSSSGPPAADDFKTNPSVNQMPNGPKANANTETVPSGSSEHPRQRKDF